MGYTGFVLRFLNPFVVTVFMTVLSACGGGGGETPLPTPPHAVSLTIGGLPGTAMLPGQSVQLTATLTYSDTSAKDVTGSAAWSPTNAAVLSVSSAGAVLAVAPGQAEVVVIAEGLTARGAFTVAIPAQPASLSIGGIPPGWMLPAQSAQLRATLTYSDGSTADVTSGTTWSSSTVGVFTVSSAGMIQSVAPGQAEVIASAQGLSSRSTVRVVRSTPQLALFAGNLGGLGNADGRGVEARFYAPRGVATDGTGNVYVADTGNNTIRKITPLGVVSTLAGRSGTMGDGGEDGIATQARFYFPGAVAMDDTGNVYVADTGNHTIRKITPAGVVSTLAGLSGSAGSGSADGIGTQARFYSPSGVATDSAGNVYVADSGNHTIRKITPAGVVTTLAGLPRSSGIEDGFGTQARFYYPDGVATDSAGNVYVADTGNFTIRKISPSGAVSTLAGKALAYGYVDGIGSEARFGQLNFGPQSVATDRLGNVYVADTGNHSVRKISPAGVVTTLAGASSAGSTDGVGNEARFYRPGGVATDSFGNIYIADTENLIIRKIDSAGRVSTLAGAVAFVGNADGIGADARFSNRPFGVAADGAGNVYVSDPGHSNIRRITEAGVVSTLTDSTGSQLNIYASGIAIDRVGNIFAVTDNFISRISPAGVVSVFAGSEAIGSADGEGTTATFGFCYIYERFSPPYNKTITERWCLETGLATDDAGNVYVAEPRYGSIRKITPTGVVSTLAKGFSDPRAVATDRFGNVYVTTDGAIWKIDPAGRVTKLAGGTYGSADGIGDQAAFSRLRGIATDSLGNVYVSDWDNCNVRKIDPAGTVTTIVGRVGVIGFTPGDLPGVIAQPQGIAVSGTSLFITFRGKGGVAVVTDVP